MISNARMSWKAELEAARRIALGAGQIALEHAARGVVAEDKPDDSPVTAADRASEAYIAAELKAAFPLDGLLGEEGGRAEARSGRPSRLAQVAGRFLGG